MFVASASEIGNNVSSLVVCPVSNGILYLDVLFLQDRHMTEASLKAAAQKRQQASGASKNPSSTAAPATPSAPAPVYPDHAAYQAISRFAIRPPYPELLVRSQ